MKVKKYWLLAVMPAICLTGIWAARSFGELTGKQQSLAEIKALYVFVQGLTEEAKKAGLTTEQIKTDVEDKLKQLGIRVVSEEEGLRLSGSPVLYVNISARRKPQRPSFVFHTDVGLLQEVSLVRDPKIRTMSITWNKGRLGQCHSRAFVESIRESVGYLMDRFREDYRAANPQAKPPKES